MCSESNSFTFKKTELHSLVPRGWILPAGASTYTIKVLSWLNNRELSAFGRINFTHKINRMFSLFCVLFFCCILLFSIWEKFVFLCIPREIKILKVKCNEEQVSPTNGYQSHRRTNCLPEKNFKMVPVHFK